MIILGINAHHADSSACLVVDGQLVAAVEEERFRRIKHWAGLPTESIRSCLQQNKLDIRDVEHIAINRKPSANILKRFIYLVSRRPNIRAIRDRVQKNLRVRDVRRTLEAEIGLSPHAIRSQLHNVEHHRAHLASSFLVSPFETSAVVSVDGFGDFVSTMIGMGTGTELEIYDQVTFPHSLGEFFLAMTQYLGFLSYGDEYKVMGLAAYGKPDYLDAFRKIVRLKPQGLFDLNLEFFLYHVQGDHMTWSGGKPVIPPIFSEQLVRLLGPPRQPDDPITSRHENLAASLQAMYEEAFFHILNGLYERTRIKTLCLAGGCALNSVANGQITQRTPFERIYIPPAAGDAGGAIGAAYTVWHEHLKKPRSFVMDRPDWGPAFGVAELREALNVRREELAAQNCRIEEISDEGVLCARTAKEIAAGKIVGWFQGRMEWGARALGQRSILADPRRPDMKDILNARIKKREPFRPFAPSILEEAVGDYFEQTAPSPFMTMTYRVKPDKRDVIPAPTHVDGTGRLQTVTRQAQPLYWKLIKAFESLTGVPVLLNTSFNENEPIVCSPTEALDCFLRTKMDILVFGPLMVTRT